MVAVTWCEPGNGERLRVLANLELASGISERWLALANLELASGIVAVT